MQKTTITTEPLDLLSAAACENPFPIYANLRTDNPVCQVRPGGIWLITRYDDVQFALKNPDIFSSSGFREMLGPNWLKNECRRDLSVLSQDPPVHTRNRVLINRAFVSRVINAMTPHMENTAVELVSHIGSGSTVDFLAHFAYPYAGRIISKITGIDQYQTVEDLRHWSEVTEVISSVRPDEQTIAAVEHALIAQNAHFSAVIEDRRNAPRDDLISAIIDAQIDGYPLDETQLINVMNLLIGAGFTTTAHALCNTLIFLTGRPDIAATLRRDPSGIPAFLEEMLRYNGPSHRLLRTTSRAVELSGAVIPAGATVLIALASANRDPEHFALPDEFDMARANIREHVAFGGGPHICIGAVLARQEIKIALEVLLRSFGTIECPAPRELSWIRSLVTCSVKELPLTLA